MGAGRWTEALPLLREAAARLEPFDVDLALETYLTAWARRRYAALARSLQIPAQYPN